MKRTHKTAKAHLSMSLIVAWADSYTGRGQAASGLGLDPHRAEAHSLKSECIHGCQHTRDYYDDIRRGQGYESA